MKGLGLEGRDSGAGGRCRAKAVWDYGDVRLCWCASRGENGKGHGLRDTDGRDGDDDRGGSGMGRWGGWLKASMELKGMGRRRK